jgi:hypothetical protein
MIQANGGQILHKEQLGEGEAAPWRCRCAAKTDRIVASLRKLTA